MRYRYELDTTAAETVSAATTAKRNFRRFIEGPPLRR
jgi:hypothetical protein